MRVAGSRQLRMQLADWQERARSGDAHAALLLKIVAAQIAIARRLPRAPVEDAPSLKRVRQSKRYEVWRLAHPFIDGIAVRTIVWFVDDETAVLALFASDKARMGDIFYDTVGQRADQIIDEWCRETPREER